MRTIRALLMILAVVSAPLSAPGQEYGKPDRDAPGDEAVQRYLADLAREAPDGFLRDVESAADWILPGRFTPMG